MDTTKEEFIIINKIIERADGLALIPDGYNRSSLFMSLEAANEAFNLRLDDFLKADDFNFAHDFVGINNNVIPHQGNKIGKPYTFEDFGTFTPRFSMSDADVRVLDVFDKYQAIGVSKENVISERFENVTVGIDTAEGLEELSVSYANSLQELVQKFDRQLANGTFSNDGAKFLDDFVHDLDAAWRKKHEHRMYKNPERDAVKESKGIAEPQVNKEIAKAV